MVASMPMRCLVWIASWALVLPACKGSGPSCADVTDHILKITMAAMPAHAGMKLANKQQMIDHCEKDLSADERQCLMEATELNGFAKCRKQPSVPPPTPAPAAQPAPTTAQPPAPPSPAAPAPSTGGSGAP